MWGSPLRRRGPDRIDVRLPPALSGAIEWAAARVAGAAATPAAPGFGRLFAPIQVGVDDDPLATLERQTVIESVVTTAARSARSNRLSEVEAEAWLQLLGLALALEMDALGIRSDADRDRLTPSAAARIDAVHALQICLMDALDGPG